MLLSVKDIPITGKEFSGQVAAQKMDIEFVFLTPIYIRGTASKTGEDVFVKARIDTQVKVQCDKCLEPFTKVIGTDIDLFYQPATSDEYMELENITLEDLGILHYRDNTIDLAVAVRDTIILETPMRLVCGEDCKGLCQHCGCNLNHENCSCNQNKASSSPFAKFFQSQQQ